MLFLVLVLIGSFVAACAMGSLLHVTGSRLEPEESTVWHVTPTVLPPTHGSPVVVAPRVSRPAWMSPELSAADLRERAVDEAQTLFGS